MKDDTISRAAALAEVMYLCEECPVQYYIGPCPSQQCDVRIMREALENLPPAQPMEDARAMCSECDAWNKYKNYPQPEQFNPCTVCQEFDCTGCKFRRT